MSNVKAMPGIRVSSDGPNEEVIELLEKFAEMARSGNIESLAIVAVTRDREVVTSSYRYDDALLVTLLGATAMLHQEIMNKVDF